MEYRTVAAALYHGTCTTACHEHSLTDIVDLLKDEVSDTDLVGPTLQSLKKLLEKVPEDAAERLKYEKVVHGLLSACLVNIDAMRFVFAS